MRVPPGGVKVNYNIPQKEGENQEFEYPCISPLHTRTELFPGQVCRCVRGCHSPGGILTLYSTHLNVGTSQMQTCHNPLKAQFLPGPTLCTEPGQATSACHRKHSIKIKSTDFPGSPGVKIYTFPAEGPGSIPGPRTKFLPAK